MRESERTGDPWRLCTPNAFRNLCWFSVVFVVALLAVTVPASRADGQVTQCFGESGVGICPVGANPCVVNTAQDIAPDAVLDCSGVDLVIANQNGRLDVSGGEITIRADSLTLESSRKIIVQGDSVARTGVRIEVSGAVDIQGKIRAQNEGGGSLISIVAGGDISLSGGAVGLDVEGIANDVDGGEVVLDAGGDVYVGQLIIANGHPNASTENMNSGGDVVITAGGDVAIEEEIRVFGRWFSGGSVSLTAGGSVAITHETGTGVPKGKIDGEGRSYSADGGSVEIQAGSGITLAGPISLAGGINNAGGDAQGGAVVLEAGCGGIDLQNIIDIWGGEGGGGRFEARSDGAIEVSGTIDAYANRLGGGGGDVALYAGGLLHITQTAVIRANGHITGDPSDEAAGTILLQGCQVDVAGDSTSGATLEAIGATDG